MAGHEGYDAVDVIGSPQRRAGAADHLYAVDIFGDDILHVPIDAGKQRRINAPAVDQDEQLVGEVLRLGISAQPPGGDGCAAGAASQHLQVRCEPQYRSEENTTELQSLMRISSAVLCLKKKRNTKYK